MELVSRCSRGFPDEDEEDDDEFSRREGSSQRVDLTVKIDGKHVEQKQPSAPRSKHSATEQRRRSKINDRLLATLTQSLESSGLDLSQASISIQINLGKRAKRASATTTSSAKTLHLATEPWSTRW